MRTLSPIPEHVIDNPDYVFAINDMKISRFNSERLETLAFINTLDELINEAKINETSQTNPEKLCVRVKIDDRIVPVDPVTSKCLVFQLKKVLAPQIGISTKDQVLIFRGTKLQDHQFLVDHNITNKSVLLMKHRFSFKITLRVLNTNGKLIWRMRVKPRLEVGHLKAKLEKMTKMSAKEQVLTFEDVPLYDKFHLDSYGITNKSSIVLQSQHSFKIDLVVRNLDTSVYLRFQATPRMKVPQMKEKIEEMSGIKANNQRLQRLGFQKDLCGDLPLADYGLDHSGVLVLKQKMVDVRIFSQVTGKLKFSFGARPDSKVKVVKKKIQELSGIRTTDQVLVFKQKHMKDFQQLREYAITDKDEIFLINLKQKINIHVAVFDFLDIFRFSVKPRLMISHLKYKINKETDIDVKEQILFVGEEVLKDQDTLHGSGVRQDTEIVLRQRQFLMKYAGPNNAWNKL